LLLKTRETREVFNLLLGGVAWRRFGKKIELSEQTVNDSSVGGGEREFSEIVQRDSRQAFGGGSP
jgi:hypothetical protein